MSTPTCTRPLLRYFGGKWMSAPHIISHMPPHRVYVELYGGAASVLLRKRRSYAEVYNDLDGEIVNLFRVLRSDDADRLVELIELTPFSRDEYMATAQMANCPIEQARQTIVRSFMGFGSNALNRDGAMSGFRNNVNGRNAPPSADWRNYPTALRTIIDRLRGVTIENKPATDLVDCYDTPDTLFYVDPPYLHETRETTNGYNHEMSNDEHGEMIARLCDVEGKVMLSGYASDMYSDLLSDWRCVSWSANADGARKRTECLWLNPASQMQMAMEFA